MASAGTRSLICHEQARRSGARGSFLARKTAMLKLPHIVLTTLFVGIAFGAFAQTPGAAPAQRARPAPLLSAADLPFRPTSDAARRAANKRLSAARHSALTAGKSLHASNARLMNSASAHQPQARASFRRDLPLPSAGTRDAKDAATGKDARAPANAAHVAPSAAMRRDQLRARSISSYRQAMRNLPRSALAHRSN
jgi:hypothetical protein